MLAVLSDKSSTLREKNSPNKVKQTYQHKNISNEKRQQVQKRPNTLLPHIRSKRRNHRTRRRTSRRHSSTIFATQRLGSSSSGVGRSRRMLKLGNVLADEKPVVFLDGAAEKFEDNAEEEDADAGAGEHAGGCDAPLGGEEA